MSARDADPWPSAAPLSEADTRAKLIGPAIHLRGCTENLIRREETAGAIEIVNGKPRKRAKGRVDHTLRMAVIPQSQPVAVAQHSSACASSCIDAKPAAGAPFAARALDKGTALRNR